MKFHFNILFILGSFVFPLLAHSAGGSLPAEEFQALQEKSMNYFIALANLPNSSVFKIIEAENKKNNDGRNPNGFIRTPVTIEDIQIVMTDGEFLINPARYFEKENDSCKATGNSATFSVFLLQNQGVHAANIFSTMKFEVSITENLEVKILGNPENVNCLQWFSDEDSDGKLFGDLITTYTVSEPILKK